MKRILQINNLGIGYQKVIQEQINLELYEGQFICLVGPNGIGKSTFLKTISHVIPALSGKVVLKGNDINSLDHQDLSKLIGLVLTDHIEGFNLKAIDVIQMGRYPHTGFWGKLNTEDLKIIEDVIHQLNIEKLIQRQFGELSDGEKQKVMVAKALVQQAPLLLLDEPTAFLDFPTKAGLFIMLKKLARTNNLGIILSTHDIELALKTADQIWLFTKNHQLIKGMPEDLVLQGHINRVFKNKDIQFNLQSGHFERLIHHTKTVHIQGDSNAIFWLKKALIRSDIGIDKNAHISISFKEKFEIKTGQKLVNQFSSIEEVICELNKIL